MSKKMPCADDFAHYLNQSAAEIETILQSLLDDQVLPGELARPPRLMAAMRYAVLGGGKRLRPFLVLETAALFDVERVCAQRAAAAVEMVHCYSLVHDDLPAMDNDDLRRGRPTTHKAFDEAAAILAGDGLLTLAFDVLADPKTHEDDTLRANLVLALSRASGLGGMVGGQALDLQAESSKNPLGLKDITLLQAMKTGALLRVSVESGVILGRASIDQREALLDYGAALGRAFQIADDILDALGDSAKLGKKAGKDAERNKATFVQALGLEQAKQACEKEVETALKALDRAGFTGKDERLRQAAHFVSQRDK